MMLGCSVSVGVSGLLESQFENEILSNIAQKIQERSKGLSEENQIDSAVALCHYLQIRRSEILGAGTYHSFKATTFRSSLQSFYTGTGACGYYTLFAARVFLKLGYQPKIVQQRVNNQWGAHITLALPLKSGEKMILVDPLFKYTFHDSLNRLSTLQDVSAHWSTYYSKHTPANYKPSYNYQQGWRHTNWDKLGVVSRSAYKILTLVIGKDRTDALSFRMWIIDAYRLQTILAFLVSGLCIGLIAFRLKSKTS
jgi:hypothetical protein